MAKIGEGDSRWIVTQRADGKNVGNWHWTEKNLFPFTEKRAKEVFVDVVLLTAKDLGDGLSLSATVTRCDRCDGESVVMNRKGKLLFIFDFSLTLRYEATLTAADKDPVKCKGEIVVKEIANDEPSPNIKVSQDENAPAKEAARVAQTLRADARAPLMRVIDSILDDMKGQIEGVRAPSIPDASGAATPATISGNSATTSLSRPADTKSGGGTLTQTLDCDVPVSELFAVFVDAQRVQAYTGAPAQVEARVGSPLSLYGGAVKGEVLTCEVGARLVLKWRAQSWPSDCWSTVTLSFESRDGSRSRLILSHTNLPSAEVERTRGFWEQQFWTRIRALFGWRMEVL
jgi:activator of HSP90 ATPase